jgi:hypothetical protein
MKPRLLIIIGIIIALVIIIIFNFDFSPTVPKIESQLQKVIDYCNDTSEVKNAILYYHSNETHSIDNIDCIWKLHQNYPDSDIICIPYAEKWVTGEEWRNQTHIFDKDRCEWKKDPDYDELNSKGCPQFCPKESTNVTISKIDEPKWKISEELSKIGCTDAMVDHLEKYSNAFDEKWNGEGVAIEDIGLPWGVHQYALDQCMQNISELRDSDLYGCNENEVYFRGICITPETKEKAQSIGENEK